MSDIKAINLLHGLKDVLSLQDSQVLFPHAHSRSFAAQEEIIKYQSMNKNVYFIQKGLVRFFYVDNKGNEITLGVLPENHIFANNKTIIRNEPSEYHYEALEPTDVLYLDFDEFNKLSYNNENLKKCKIYFYENLLGILEDKINSFIIKTSKERYLDFVKAYPNLNQRVPDKYIANILGVTPVQLSRIRKQIAVQKE